jgi:hypothetical protein
MFDVFLSYRHADADDVRVVVAALREAGLTVWLDESAIEDFVSIQRGIDAKNNPALTLQRPPRILFSVYGQSVAPRHPRTPVRSRHGRETSNSTPELHPPNTSKEDPRAPACTARTASGTRFDRTRRNAVLGTASND